MKPIQAGTRWKGVDINVAAPPETSSCLSLQKPSSKKVPLLGKEYQRTKQAQRKKGGGKKAADGKTSKTKSWQYPDKDRHK